MTRSRICIIKSKFFKFWGLSYLANISVILILLHAVQKEFKATHWKKFLKGGLLYIS